MYNQLAEYYTEFLYHVSSDESERERAIYEKESVFFSSFPIFLCCNIQHICLFLSVRNGFLSFLL